MQQSDAGDCGVAADIDLALWCEVLQGDLVAFDERHKDRLGEPKDGSYVLLLCTRQADAVLWEHNARSVAANVPVGCSLCTEALNLDEGNFTHFVGLYLQEILIRKLQVRSWQLRNRKHTE